ncbi:MFS transporter [Paenibacillus ferrarius]|uniref:MFS transporter n=1 Tax=Paenibacillus ferrarius TaxID=1469647 RepID=UPI003D281038
MAISAPSLPPVRTEIREQTLMRTADKLLRVLMLTMSVSMMTGIMFNIALPRISAEFSLTIAQVSWMSSAYILIYAVGSVTYGKLADRFPLKNLVTAGLLVFALGSLLGLTSHGFAAALAGRCLQAAGAAVIPAMSMIIPLRYFAPERRGAALGMTAVGLAFGNALGPVIAALIVSSLNWRWLFAVPLVVLAALPLFRKYLGDERPQPQGGTFDWLGGLLLGAAIALLLLSVTQGSWLLGLALPAAALFVLRIRVAREPFIAPHLFRNARYTLGLTVSFLVSATCCSLYVVSPLLLTDVQRLPSLWIGFVMVPAAIASAAFGRAGGRLADTKGNLFVVCVASSLLAACFALLSVFAGGSPVLISALLMLGNVGQSFLVIALSNAVSRTLPAEQVGVGMGMLSMANFIGQGMAIGTYSRIVDHGAATTSPLNPFYGYGEGAVFSNMYLAIAAAQVIIWALYALTFSTRRATTA